MRVFIRNFPYETSERELADLFQPYGASDLLICRDRGGDSKGFGFITLEDAESAITDLKGKDVGGRPLYIEPARVSARRVPIKAESPRREAA